MAEGPHHKERVRVVAGASWFAIPIIPILNAAYEGRALNRGMTLCLSWIMVLNCLKI